jgi:hypothetical protein
MFSDTVCCINPKMGVSHKRGMVHKCEIIDQRNSCHFQSQLSGLASRPWHASAHVMRGQFNPPQGRLPPPTSRSCPRRRRVSDALRSARAGACHGLSMLACCCAALAHRSPPIGCSSQVVLVSKEEKKKDPYGQCPVGHIA